MTKLEELEARVERLEDLEKGILSLTDLYKLGRLKVMHSHQVYNEWDSIGRMNNGKLYGCDYCILPQGGDHFILVVDDVCSVDWEVRLNMGKRLTEVWRV